MSQFHCWQCGKLLQVLMPVSRREVCDACNADQHVCRLCQYYDAAISDQCREDRAERVSDKDKANFCDYFSPNPKAYDDNGNIRQTQAQAKLEALFGAGNAATDITSKSSPQDKSEAAKQALEDLFNPPKTD